RGARAPRRGSSMSLPRLSLPLKRLRDRYDVVVVSSIYGGAVAACSARIISRVAGMSMSSGSDHPDAAMERTESGNRQPSRDLTVGKVGEFLWASLFEALAATIVLFALGGVAVGILAALLPNMVPSSPPIIDRAALPERPDGVRFDVWSCVPRQHRFGMVFGALFLWIAGLQLGGYPGTTRQREPAALFRRLSGKFSEHCFGLIVGTAFAASGAALF